MRELVTLGRLINIEVYNPQSRKVTKKAFKGKWLCTSGNGKDLLLCRILGPSDRRVSGAVAARHRKFHKESSKGAWKGELLEPVGRLRQVGLLKALTYEVPNSKIRSPEKNPYHWHHAFGDTGHRGGSYPSKYFPAVLQDSKGNFFFKRRPGNIFKNTDWIRG